MKIRIPVTPYVHAYLATKYGPDPYDLTHTSRNDLRMTFQHLWLNVDLWPRIRHGHFVVMDLREDPQLIKSYEYNKPMLQVGGFFQGEFMRAMRGYVKAQEELATSLSLSPGLWNKKWAIEQFLNSHNVDPGCYDFFSAYRQYNRLKQADFSEMAGKMTTKFDFRPSDNQAFRLCSMSFGQKNRIIFWAYSRSHQDIRRCEHRIPAKISSSGDWLGYAKMATQVINDLLLKGHTIK